jgi:hypothetical protein
MKRKYKFGKTSETMDRVCFAISGTPNVVKDDDDIANAPSTCSLISVAKLRFCLSAASHASCKLPLLSRFSQTGSHLALLHSAQTALGPTHHPPSNETGAKIY